MIIRAAQLSPGSLSKFCILASLAAWLPIGLAFGLWGLFDPPHSPFQSGGGVAYLFLYVLAAALWAVVNGSILFAGGIALRALGGRGPRLTIEGASQPEPPPARD